MLPPLVLDVKPIKKKYADHAPCLNQGSNLKLLSRHGQILMTVVAGTIDRACFEAVAKKVESSPKSNRLSEAYPLVVVESRGTRTLRWSLQGRDIPIPPRHYGVINPREHSWLDTDQTFVGVMVTLTQPMLRACREAVQLPKAGGPFAFRGAVKRAALPMRRVLEELKRVADDALVEPNDPYRPWRAWGAGFTLLHELWRSHPSGLRKWHEANGFSSRLDPRLQAVLQYLARHAFEPFAVAPLVAHSGFSRRDLFRRFQRVLGVSPRAWVTRVRVEEAERLLASSSQKNWKGVADRVGFQSAWALKKAIRHVRGPLPAR